MNTTKRTSRTLSKFSYRYAHGERAQVLPDLNRTALAQAVGISRSQVSRILSGKSTPPLDTLRKLAQAFGMGIERLDRILQTIKEENEWRGRL